MHPEQFDKIIFIPYLDEESRMEILKVSTSSSQLKQLNTNVDLRDIASKTNGKIGLDNVKSIPKTDLKLFLKMLQYECKEMPINGAKIDFMYKNDIIALCINNVVILNSKKPVKKEVLSKQIFR